MGLFERYGSNPKNPNEVITPITQSETPKPNISEKSFGGVFLFSIKEMDFDVVSLSLDNNIPVWGRYGKSDVYTYIMEDYSFGCYKIGMTKKSPLQRLKDFQTGNPSIKFLTAFPSEYFSEKMLHTRFDKYRKISENDSGNEWFFKSRELMSFVEEEMQKQQTFYKLYEQQNELNKTIKKNLETLC